MIEPEDREVQLAPLAGRGARTNLIDGCFFIVPDLRREIASRKAIRFR